MRRLDARDDVEAFGVDDRAPGVEFASSFEQISLDRLALARYVLEIEPDVVIHLQSVQRSSEEGAAAASDERIVGALALFGAIERLDSVSQVIVKSDSAVYGSSPRNPSILREATGPRRDSDRFARDLGEMESFIENARSRHPHVAFTVLRFAPILGPTIRNPISRYLTLPVVPTMMGFDPRLQFIGEDDAVGAVVHAMDHPVDGVFNVASRGQLYLSRVLRLGHRAPQLLPGRIFEGATRALAQADVPVPAHIRGLLKHGRVLDTTAMRTELRFHPSLTCRQTVLNTYGRLPEPAHA